MRYSFLVLFLFACDKSVEQSAACEQWVSCIDARDQLNGVSTNMVRFLPIKTDADGEIIEGQCWGNPEISDLCDKGCIAGLEKMGELYDDLPQECQQ
ncbi:MAG: hypothetical protein VXW32_04000 [Myxococcota bacterium]|nr:hypothetical protein [Myxococcota bacterium]